MLSLIILIAENSGTGYNFSSPTVISFSGRFFALNRTRYRTIFQSNLANCINRIFAIERMISIKEYKNKRRMIFNKYEDTKPKKLS
jgi:hypothetical protein